MPGIDLGLTNTWSADVEGIDVSERVLGGPDSVTNRPLRQLGNRTEFLYARTLSASPTSVVIPLGPASYNASDRWAQNSDGVWEQSDVSGTSSVRIWVPMPRFGLLTKVRWYVKHSGSHGALPATMPTFTLSRCLLTAPEPLSTAATATDTSASVGAYESTHAVESASFTHLLTGGAAYRVTLAGELGANSLAGLRVYALQLDLEPG